MIDGPSTIAKICLLGQHNDAVVFVVPRVNLKHITINILILGKWYLPDESKPNVHFNTYLVKTVFHEVSVIRVSFLMETDFFHSFQPYRFFI